METDGKLLTVEEFLFDLRGDEPSKCVPRNIAVEQLN